MRWVLALAACAWAGGDLDRQWKARALQAVEKLDSMNTVMKKDKSKTIGMEYILEFAYANIINPELKSTVKKKTSRIYAYHLLLNIGDRENNMLDVAYLYDVKTEDLLGVRIDRLPNGWGIRPDAAGGAESLFMVSNLNDLSIPAFIFSKKKPFDVVVLNP